MELSGQALQQGIGSTGPQEGPIDAVERDRLLKLANEAAERLNFHSQECERWERTGRAAMAAVTQFDMANPVAEWSIDRFVDSQSQPMAKDVSEVRY